MLTQEQKEFLEKWIAALEGGRYKQGKQYLKQRGADGKLQYCCLGVASALCKIPVVGFVSNAYNFNFPDGFISRRVPPTTWWEETSGMAEVLLRNLTHANDSGFTFKEIATALKRYLKNDGAEEFDYLLNPLKPRK